MNEKLKVRLEIWVLILGLVGGGSVISIIGYLFSFPTELKATQTSVKNVEFRVEKLERTTVDNREILIRIEERVKQLQEKR